MVSKSRCIGIIPARYGSTRFPGKPLVDIKGKPMIWHVYEQAKKVLDYVCVATDDIVIADAVSAFGGKAVMTAPDHQSGTDRIAEALEKIESEGVKADVVINIQGDEPFIEGKQIEQLISCFNIEGTDIATLIKKIENKEDLFNPNKPKVAISRTKKALLFSRSTIPYVRGKNEDEWFASGTFYKHIGIYAYKVPVLKEITKLGQSPLELLESLEQLRWLENGYAIQTDITDYEAMSVDTPEDLEKLLASM